MDDRVEASRPVRTFRVAAALLAVLMVALVTAGCGSDEGGSGSSEEPSSKAAVDPAPQATGDAAAIQEIFGPGGKEAGEGLTIPVGMVLAMTGPGSFTGEVMSRGAKLAAAQIKAAGGPTFQISIADHQGGEVAPGVAGARRLITQNNVPVLLSSYGGVTKALIPLVRQNEVLTFNGGGPDPTQAGHPFLWLPANFYADDSAPGSLAYLARENPEAKRLAIIGTEENGVNALKNLVPKYWPEVSNGGTVVARETHDVGQTDFSQLVARVKAANPDVIWTASFGNDMGYIMKALRQGGVDAPVMGTELSPEACKVAPEAYDTFEFAGSYFDPATTNNPWARLFSSSYRKAYDQEPEIYGGTYYEDMFIVWELVKRVVAKGGDPMSGVQLQEALEEDPNFKTIIGGSEAEVDTLSMDPGDHTGSRPMGVYGVTDCKARQLAEITKLDPGEDIAATLVD
jgi:branched-chain amino acid transport system substrate-binding protein